MPGEVKTFSGESNELDFLKTPQKANLRVSELKDPGLPEANLEKAGEEQKTAPVKTVKVPNLLPLPKKVEVKNKRERSIFAIKNTRPVELDRRLIDRYGIDWLEWLPETLYQTIRADFDTSIAAINRDKIGATQLLHVSDSFWRNWEVFEKVALAFSNITPMFDRVQDLSMGQIIFCIMQANEIRKEPFEEEVRYYIAAIAKGHGFIYLPPPADIAQKELDELNPSEVSGLKKEIRERWDAFEGTSLLNIEFREDIYGIHLARLAAINEVLTS